ncbi:MAG: glycosyltransferase family 4 protein [Oligoflexia bacterium]|nr:glycosyltransferase family 4 protein [Oligoflexia bacterium]
MSAKKFAFIIPRFFTGVAGGAETLTSSIAARLAARGDQVEIWTTCARDNRTWENSFSPGESREGMLHIKRFAVDPRNLDRWAAHQIALNDGLRLDLESQLEWLEQGVNSTALYRHIERCGPQFDALFFAPYLFGTTFFGSLIHPQNSYLFPCLHDESYAYLQSIASMFRQVRGSFFNSAPERVLAERLYGSLAGGVVGMGFDPFAAGYVSDLQPLSELTDPYLLYLGRKETGKGAHLLIDNFLELKQRADLPARLKLVICGGGDFADLKRAQALTTGDVIDIKHASETDKHRLLKYCQFLVQPSVNESFSIVLMEAWLLKRPVLVNGNCAVTRQHVVDSGGGLYFSSPADFGAVCAALLSDKALNERCGKAGFEYVSSEYSWPAVLERFDQTLTCIQDPPSLGSSSVTHSPEPHRPASR